jgi:hypothetical protein
MLHENQKLKVKSKKSTVSTIKAYETIGCLRLLDLSITF